MFNEEQDKAPETIQQEDNIQETPFKQTSQPSGEQPADYHVPSFNRTEGTESFNPNSTVSNNEHQTYGTNHAGNAGQYNGYARPEAAHGAYNAHIYRPENQRQYYADSTRDRTAETKKKSSMFLPIALTAVITALLCTGIGLLLSNYLDRPTTEVRNPSVIPTSSPTTSANKEENPSLGLTYGDGSSDEEDTELSIVEECRRTIVSINVEIPTSTYYGESISTGAGSGVIIKENGYIVTCNHVIDTAHKITVTLPDGTTYDAELIGRDARTDLAVIKIDAKNLPSAVIGDSTAYSVGERIYAVGNPLGEFASTVTDGIISGLDRIIEVDGESMTLMQTNAAINPGNSGGGLFSAVTGELIGIVNAKSYGIEVEGLGFAIPTATAKGIITDLMDLGYVAGRPYIGISMQEVTQNGMYGGLFATGNVRVKITSVTDGSPAEAAGLKSGDYIVSLDGTSISSIDDLTGLLNNYDSGDVITMVVERSGSKISIKITLGEASGN